MLHENKCIKSVGEEGNYKDPSLSPGIGATIYYY